MHGSTLTASQPIDRFPAGAGAGRVLTCQGLFDSAKNLQSDQVKSEIALERSNLVYQELILLLWQLVRSARRQVRLENLVISAACMPC